MAYDGRLLAGVTVLMAVVEAGTIVRAAEGLGLTPSGVSRALARLETRVGVRLLDRTTRSMALTEEGRRFYEQVGPHLEGIEAAAVEAAGATAAVRGRLRVNVNPFFSQMLLAPRVAEFLARYPELSLELITRSAAGDLIADGFDLAVQFGDPPAGSLIARKLIETRVLTVAAPAYLDRHGRPHHPSEIVDHVCIDFWDTANRRPFDWEFHRRHEVLPVKIKTRLVTSDPGALLAVVEAGTGIAQILQLGARQSFERGTLVNLFPDWCDELFPLYALYPTRHGRAAKVRAFVDFCAEILQA